MEEVERTLKVNVGYVGDVQAALANISPNRYIEVRGPLNETGLAIEEISLHDDGHIVIYVGPR